MSASSNHVLRKILLFGYRDEHMRASSEVRALFDLADDVDDSCRHSRPFWGGLPAATPDDDGLTMD